MSGGVRQMDGKIRVLVADTDVEYSASFVRFISEKHGSKFTVALVNNPEKLGRLLDAGYRADALVVSTIFLKTLEVKLLSELINGFEGILLLKEVAGQTNSEPPKFRGYLGVVQEVSKYQKVDEIVNNICTLHSDVSKIERPMIRTRGVSKIGIFSPIGGSGRTFLSALIAKYLASIKKKVVLLSFEDVSSLQVYFPGMPEGRASELFLGIKTREGAINPEEFIWNDEESGVSILLPSKSVSEPCELSSEEIEKLLGMNLDEFDFVISDFSAWDCVKAMKGLQSQDLVVFPSMNDKSSEIKTNRWIEFCRGFEGERFEELLKRTICVVQNSFLRPESEANEVHGFSEKIMYQRIEGHDAGHPLVREFVSKLL